MHNGVGRRLSSDPVLLLLWCGLGAAAPIGSLAWEPPYAAGAALKRQKQIHTHTKSFVFPILENEVISFFFAL